MIKYFVLDLVSYTLWNGNFDTIYIKNDAFKNRFWDWIDRKDFQARTDNIIT